MGSNTKKFGMWLLSIFLMIGAIGCGPTKKRIVFVTNGDDPFWDVFREGMNKAAEDQNLSESDYVVELDKNDGTDKGQIAKLNQYANSSDVVAVGISVKDSKNATIAKAMKRLRESGIKVITVDSDIDRNLHRDCRFAYIGTDNIIAGRELGVAAKALKPEGGNYTAYAGFKSAANVIERVKGFGEGAGDKFKKLALYEDGIDQPVARSNVRDSIGHFPDQIDFFVGIWAYNAHHIVESVKDKDFKTKPKIVVFDAATNALDDMDKGLIDAMMVQNPYQMGYKTVKLLKAMIDDDQDVIREMYPAWKPGTDEFEGEKGDLHATGLRIVVPDNSSPIKKEMFRKETKFYTIKEFREWLKERNLTSS